MQNIVYVFDTIEHFSFSAQLLTPKKPATLHNVNMMFTMCKVAVFCFVLTTSWLVNSSCITCRQHEQADHSYDTRRQRCGYLNRN